MISSLISLKNKGRDADSRIQTIAFFYRIANQLVDQGAYEKLEHYEEFRPDGVLGNYNCSEKLELPCQAEMRKQSLRVITDGKAGTASRLSVDSRTSCSQIIQTASKCHHVAVHMVTQSFPSPIISCVESLPQGAHLSQIIAADSENEHSKSYDVPTTTKLLRDIHVSTRLMEDFLELAKDNTDKDLETCGILGAFLEKGTFYVTTLIIPKQESTSSSCQAINEEEVFAIQNEGSLFPVGWIHTHPSQSCFMSSVDLHTQYSYQAMVPEAFAIVMAPTDTSRSYGIFRLSEPGGMSVLKECQEKGFHPHQEPADECPIYEHCSNIYKNSNLRFEIFDLR